MKCEEILSRYLNNKDERYPSLQVRLHIVHCAGCREEIGLLKHIFQDAAISGPYPMRADMSDIVMKKIMDSDFTYSKNVSPFKWIFSGATIFLSIFAVSYSDSFLKLREHFGREIDIPLNIVLGLAITSYAASYIGTHMSDLKKFAEYINHKMH